VLKHNVNVLDKKLNRFLLSSDEVAQYFMNFSWRFHMNFTESKAQPFHCFTTSKWSHKVP